MANFLRILKDAAVYVNTISVVGMAKSIALPDVARTTEDHETLAMIGTIAANVGFEAMETTIAWEGWSPEIAVLVYNTEDKFDIQCRGTIEDMTGDTNVLTPCIVHMKGVFRSTGGGNYEAKAKATRESVANVHYFKEEIDGVTMVEVDFANNIYKVGGKNLLEDRNRILGLV